MQKPLSGMKAAILLANGFNENEMTVFQRGMMEAGATPRIISVENGLANGWQEKNWGHYYAVDCPLSDALAADYDILIIPGGQRSLDKLKLTAHARRFIGGFMAAFKPVMLLSDALSLLIHTGHANGLMAAGPDTIKDQAIAAGVIWSEHTPTIQGNVISAAQDADLKELVEILINFRLSQVAENEQHTQAA